MTYDGAFVSLYLYYYSTIYYFCSPQSKQTFNKQTLERNIQLVILYSAPRDYTPHIKDHFIVKSHLTVHSKQDNHDEEECSPQLGNRHQGYGTRIGNECQTWACNGSIHTLA